MQSRYAKIFQFIIIVGDLLLLNLCFLLAGALRFDEIKIEETQYYDYYIQLIAFFNISWLLLTLAFRTHEIRVTLEPRKATSKVLNAYFLHIFLLLVVLVSSKRDDYSRLFLIYFYTSFLLTVLPWRFLFLRMLKSYRKRGLNFRKVVLVGDGKGLLKFYENIKNHPEYGLKMLGYYSDKPIAGLECAGSEQDFLNMAKDISADELYAAYGSDSNKLMEWYHWADDNLMRFRVIPDLGLEYTQGIKIDYYDDVPVLLHRKEPLEYVHNRILKRLADILLSIAVIVLIFPWLFPLLAIGVRLSGKGPVFFKQQRTGIGDDAFSIYKFRSMRLNDDADKQQALENDSRLTTFGRFIRRHSLDELPQFFNVLIGDMSVCGPRPHMLAHTNEYKKVIDRYMVRHLVKPGITGLAQINGYRGEVRNVEDIEGRVKNDVYYIENWSILLDFKIIMTTIFNALIGK